MKNLVQLGERRRRVNLGESLDSTGSNYVVDISHVFTDEIDSDQATVVLTNDGILSRMTSTGEISWTCNLEELKSGGGWFDVSFVDPELVCLSKNGAIATVNPATGEAEVVGVFDYGLEAAAWSPDREVLLMVTSTADEEEESKTNSVLLSMNSHFEVLAEITISPFVPSGSSNDSRISVSWRPDGSLCAVSSVDVDDNTRKVRIYKRETLELHAIGRSEDASGTIVKSLQDSGLAWASAGCSQLLATVQRKGKKTTQVVFFESNGLRHREFVLRENPTTSVTSLTWNASSDLLAVALREEGGTDKVQLWHRCNYHWYLKSEFRYPGQSVVRVKFNEEKPSEFYVFLRDLEWREYEARWDPSTSLPIPGCPVFVVDGCSLNITPLEKALVPPPMFMTSVTMDFPIRDISFCRGGHRAGTLLISLSDGNLVFLSCADGNCSNAFKPIKVTWEDTKEFDLTSLRSFLVVETGANELQAVAISCAPSNEECESIVEISISGLDTTGPVANIVGSYLLEGRVLRMVQWSDSLNGSLLQLHDGSLLEYEMTDNGSSVLPSEVEPLLEPCPWISGIKDTWPYCVNDRYDEGHSRMIFGLSTRSRLYFHDLMLTDSASSFFLSISHEYICYATAGSRCQLRFLPLKEVNNFDPLMGLDHNHVLEGYEPRNVERGSRIVAILPSQPRAVLQMPRGNLEGIYPRALVLQFVMKKITMGEYGEAFRMMRTHKVDLNLFVDFDPWHFLEKGISRFFDQVPNIDHLNLFISGLQDLDITQYRFPIPPWFQRENTESKQRSSFDWSTKVNQVCSQARSTMFQVESESAKPEGHFLLPVLSTFAKENPPRLDEALSLIKEIAFKQNPSTSKKPPLFSDKAQNSIHYLAFLAEYELLYETALGMYDYDLARAVARNSQMDPKVYLPYLKRLNEIPVFFGRFEVDTRLKRFESALKNLFQSYSSNEKIDFFIQEQDDAKRTGNKFENCLSLIEEHDLYKCGLELFENNASQRRVISVSLGEHKLKEKQPETALSVFLAADPPCLEGAKRAARAADDWRCYFALLEDEDAREKDESPQNFEIKRRQIAREMADEIVAKLTPYASKEKQEVCSNAARVLLDYGNDLFGAVDMLLQGGCWGEAHRVASLHSRDDLIKKCTEGAISHAYAVMEEFEERASTFSDSNKRYSDVLKLRKQAVFLEGPTLPEADETGSLFSVASTLSNMSLRSNTSTTSTSTGVSSIISVKSATTFTMTGGDEGYRHRSKFNKGKKQKKPRKKKSRKPTVEEELKSLVNILRTSCADAVYVQTVEATIRYLIFVQQLSLASDVFNRYNSMRDAIEKSRVERVETTRKEKAEAERTARMQGEQHDDNHVLVELPIEKEMDELACAVLPESLRDFFSLF